MGFSTDWDNKKVWYEFDGNYWLVRIGLCFSRPFGMRFKKSGIKFMGRCWWWHETNNSFHENHLLWFGIVAISFGKTIYTHDVLGTRYSASSNNFGK